ncbi:MAG: hypothetical protein WKF97_20995 [Chitinophagaceae bacterium]
MEDTPQIEFRFTGIQIISKKMEETPKDFTSVVFNFDIRIENRIRAESDLVIPFVFVNIRFGDKIEYLASFIIACLFRVSDFKKYIILNENKVYDVPRNLTAIIHPVSISTARGVIFSELRGTYLNNAIMPVVYMKDFKEELQNESQPKELAIMVDNKKIN